ncbi:MAG TPA: hypothetical protein VJU61_23845, partial [Polyangiaceae bacterium]|nr:hypothetical protein [Polyangiaceae bacterium]
RDGFACNAGATLSLAAEPAVRGVQDWRCSESSPCYGGENPDTCRETREPVLGRDQVRVAVTGPNSFAIRGCRYTRGGSGGGACGGVAQGNYQGSWQQVCTYSDEYGSETISGPLALNVQGNRVVMSVNSGNEFDITTELTGTLQPDGSFQIDIEDCILQGTVRNDTATGTFVCDSSEDGYIDLCNGTWSAPRSGQ